MLSKFSVLTCTRSRKQNTSTIIWLYLGPDDKQVGPGHTQAVDVYFAFSAFISSDEALHDH